MRLITSGTVGREVLDDFDSISVSFDDTFNDHLYRIALNTNIYNLVFLPICFNPIMLGDIIPNSVSYKRSDNSVHVVYTIDYDSWITEAYEGKVALYEQALNAGLEMISVKRLPDSDRAKLQNVIKTTAEAVAQYATKLPTHRQ